MKAITVRQPWAWLHIYGGKDIENRDWYTAYRGPIAIHAAKGMTYSEYEDARDFVRSFDPRLSERMPMASDLVRGAVIGTMVLRDCVRDHRSPWFQGPFGFVMDAPTPLDPISSRGALGLWNWESDAERRTKATDVMVERGGRLK